MSSTRTVVRAEAGVVLTRVDLPGSEGGLLASAWVLTSKRSPESWTFESAQEAEEAFKAELGRCGHS